MGSEREKRMKKREGVPYLLLVAFMIAGIGLLFVGYMMHAERKEQLDRYEMTRGHITDCVGNNRAGASSTFAAVHTYEVDGKEYSFQDMVYKSKKPKIGTKEKIMYNPQNPSEAFVKDSFSLYQFFFLLGGMAIVIPLSIILTASINSDRWREFWKDIILGVVFAGLGFGFCFGLIGTLDFKAVITFILGCFGVYFIGYGFCFLFKTKE